MDEAHLVGQRSGADVVGQPAKVVVVGSDEGTRIEGGSVKAVDVGLGSRPLAFNLDSKDCVLLHEHQAELLRLGEH